MSRPKARRARAAVVLLTAVAVGGALFALRVPSGSLLGSIVVGIAFALAGLGREAIPDGVFRPAQALIGVSLGTLVTASSLNEVADSWLPVATLTFATLALSILVALVMARTTALDVPTATLGMMAGGASGVLAISRELNADDRLVALMQYTRVLFVVASLPVAILLLAGGGASAADPGEMLFGAPAGWLLAIGIGAIGAWIGLRTGVTGGVLLVPLALAALVASTLPGLDFEVPGILRELGFAAVGLQVGLHFTAATFRAVGALVIPIALSMLVLIGGCFGFAVILSAASSLPLWDSYLATTPGGFPAVAAASVSTGADATFVIAVQTVRLVAALALAPVTLRLLKPVTEREQVR